MRLAIPPVKIAARFHVAPVLVALVLCQAMVMPGSAAFWDLRATQTTGWQAVDTVTIEADGGLKPMLSPDGRWIAGVSDLDARHLCIWEVSSGEQRCNEESDRVAEASIAWSPDSRQVAYSQNGHELDSDVFVLEVRSNSLTNLTDDHVDDLKSARTASEFVIYDKWPVWNDDGSELYFLRILNPRDEQGQRQISMSRVILDTGQVVRGPDLVTDEPLAYVAETVGVIIPPVRTSDGTMYFSLRGGRDVSGVYQVDPEAQTLTLLQTDPAIRPSNVPLVTGHAADGDQLSMYWLWNDVSLGNERYAYSWFDPASGEIAPIEIRVPRRMHMAAPPVFSPDGTAVIYGLSSHEANHDSTVVVQDLETGEVQEVATGVNLQFWESLTGFVWTTDNQVVLPMQNGDFSIITLAQD